MWQNPSFGGFELWLKTFRKNWISCLFSMAGWQVWPAVNTYDKHFWPCALVWLVWLVWLVCLVWVFSGCSPWFNLVEMFEVHSLDRNHTVDSAMPLSSTINFLIYNWISRDYGRDVFHSRKTLVRRQYANCLRLSFIADFLELSKHLGDFLYFKKKH